MHAVGVSRAGVSVAVSLDVRPVVVWSGCGRGVFGGRVASKMYPRGILCPTTGTRRQRHHTQGGRTLFVAYGTFSDTCFPNKYRTIRAGVTSTPRLNSFSRGVFGVFLECF